MTGLEAKVKKESVATMGSLDREENQVLKVILVYLVMQVYQVFLEFLEHLESMVLKANVVVM